MLTNCIYWSCIKPVTLDRSHVHQIKGEVTHTSIYVLGASLQHHCHLAVQVVVTYGQDEVNQFIDLADAIEEEFPELQVEGVEIEQDRQGFSVKTEDGKIVLERKSAGPFPEASSIIESLKEAGFQ